MSNLMLMTGKQRLHQVGTCLTIRRNITRVSRVFSVKNEDECNTKLGGVFQSCGVDTLFGNVKREFQTWSSPLCRRTPTSLIRHGREEEKNPEKEYRKMLEDAHGLDERIEAMKNPRGAVITVPVHLEKRLEKRMKRENTKRAIRERIIRESREGNKSKVIIHCRRQAFNHYQNQTYERNKDPPLASEGWRHKKSAGDFFTLFPGFRGKSPFYMTDTQEMTFADLGVHERVCENLKNMGIQTPTHIQVFGILHLLKANRTIIAAETGCGKTLVYLLPVITQILKNKRYSVRQKPAHPSVVILSPSRELADQIYEVAQQLTYNLDINVKLVQGGNLGIKLKNPPKVQTVDILVATTNALKVLSTAGVYGISDVFHVVLDEADTLLDDSFFPELVGPFISRFEWGNLHKDIQLTLVSATFPKGLKETLGEFMDPEFDECSTPGLHSLLPHVPQTFLRLRKSQKPDKIKEIVAKELEAKRPVMIFCNKSKTCDWLSHYLNDNGLDCAAVHGRMPMKFRRGRIDMFKRGEINVITSTDLASRGIDTVRTQHVINYEFPLHLADYIHRCGRTGRVGSLRECRVTNFISRPGEIRTVNEIEMSVRKDRGLADVNANIKKLFNQHYGEFKTIDPIEDDDDDDLKDEHEVDDNESDSDSDSDNELRVNSK